MQMILNQSVEEWPRCQVLLAWHSQGFPLRKAQEYVSLRKPTLINNVFKQDLLLDRRSVYDVLTANKVPIPNHVVVSRTQDEVENGLDPEGFVETADYVAMVRSLLFAIHLVRRFICALWYVECGYHRRCITVCTPYAN